jgi:hypothetical protein
VPIYISLCKSQSKWTAKVGNAAHWGENHSTADLSPGLSAAAADAAAPAAVELMAAVAVSSSSAGVADIGA